MRNVKRGEIYWANLDPIVGSEQGGYRPVLIIQNDKGNLHSPTTIIAIITTRKKNSKLPTHHWIESECGLMFASMVECEQIKTIDKSRLKDYIGEISPIEMKTISKKIKVSLSI